jgi:hypothetical protein
VLEVKPLFPEPSALLVLVLQTPSLQSSQRQLVQLRSTNQPVRPPQVFVDHGIGILNSSAASWSSTSSAGVSISTCLLAHGIIGAIAAGFAFLPCFHPSRFQVLNSIDHGYDYLQDTQECQHEEENSHCRLSCSMAVYGSLGAPEEEDDQPQHGVGWRVFSFCV